ncbi:MAG TPA: response regulator [Spirochaetia bacterium]|nr:response regulator [Spirochaetia bacterium]
MGMKVLVVDDSRAIRQSIRFILEQNGYEILEGSDGVEGLEKLASARVDLIITDVNMPNMDGITFIKKVREKADLRFVPILVLTTESQQSVMEEAKAAGATGWIVKPFSTDKLLAAVRLRIGF